MDYYQKEITLGSPFAELNDQELQKLQENVDQYVEFCQNLLENMDKIFMLRFHGATQKQLYITMCAYEKDPNHLFEFASLTCALNILTDLTNEKYYNQSQSPTQCNQLDDQGNLEENLNMESNHENEEYMEKWNPSKEDHKTIEGLQDANLRIENVHDMNESPIKVHEDQHDEVESFIQEGAFEAMNIIASYDDDISDFLCINEGKWDVGNHHLDYDLVTTQTSRGPKRVPKRATARLRATEEA